MKEFIEKLIGRLEEYKYTHLTEHESEECLHCKQNEDDWCDCRDCLICAFEKSEKIVNQLAEEYNNGWIEELLEAKKNCGEDSDCSECYFGQIEDRCILAELQIEKENGWIPLSEQKPTERKSYLVSHGQHTSVYIEEWNGMYFTERNYAGQPIAWQ